MIVAIFVYIQRKRIQIWKVSAINLLLGLLGVIAGDVASNPEEIGRAQIDVCRRSLPRTARTVFKGEHMGRCALGARNAGDAEQ